MTAAEQSLLRLLSDALWKGRIPETVPDEVLEEAQKQAVNGLLESGKARLAGVARFVRYTYAEQQLVRLLEDSGIPLVMLKGSAAAVYYPEPSRRSFGDLDFLVPPAFFTAACRVLEENGYQKKSVPEEEDRHIEYEKDGLVYELHRRFSYADLDIEQYILDGLERRETGRIGEHSFPMLPPLANGLVLLAHMRSHLKSGLGLRQVIDWMMYCDKVLDDAFWAASFEAAAESVGLKTLAVVTTRLCQKYLGLKQALSWCRDADERLVDSLLESLLFSGNFGVKQGSGTRGATATALIRKEGLLRHLQTAGEYNWKAYHAHPGLRPLCWCYQIFRYLGQGLKRGRRLKGDMDLGNQRYALMKKLGLI